MTRNLKVLGLALLAVAAVGAVGAQGALGAVEHEFHSDGPWTIYTGQNIATTKLQVGAAGTVECTTAEYEAQAAGTEVSAGTYRYDQITGKTRSSGCTFGGQPATVNFNHCNDVHDSDTTTGNPDGGEHANMEIECAAGSRIEIDTSVCTITIGAQTLTDAVRYENDTVSSIKFHTTAKNIVLGKAKTTESQTGCLLFPTGAIGTSTGTMTVKCYKDEGSVLTGTEKTTPQGLTTEGPTTGCTVS